MSLICSEEFLITFSYHLYVSTWGEIPFAVFRASLVGDGERGGSLFLSLLG